MRSRSSFHNHFTHPQVHFSYNASQQPHESGRVLCCQNLPNVDTASITCMRGRLRTTAMTSRLTYTTLNLLNYIILELHQHFLQPRIHNPIRLRIPHMRPSLYTSNLFRPPILRQQQTILDRHTPIQFSIDQQKSTTLDTLRHDRHALSLTANEAELILTFRFHLFEIDVPIFERVRALEAKRIFVQGDFRKPFCANVIV
jgi:hypothetical protein